MTKKRIKRKLPVKMKNEYPVNTKALNTKPSRDISFKLDDGKDRKTYSLNTDQLQKTQKSETNIKDYNLEPILLAAIVVILILLKIYNELKRN